MGEYVPNEFPKWVHGVVVQNAAEESAQRAALPEAAVAAGAAELARPPSRAGIRMRRTRERRREGKLSIRVDISVRQIEALAAAGFIDPASRGDAAEVAQGIVRAMDYATRSALVATLRVRTETAT